MKRGEFWPGLEPDLNPVLRHRAEQACIALLRCFTGISLLEFRSVCGADGDLPDTFDVEADFLHAGID